MRANTIRHQIFRRLMRGPATREELAEAAWGHGLDWPENWDNAVQCHLQIIRAEIAGDGLEVHWTSLYEIKDAH